MSEILSGGRGDGPSPSPESVSTSLELKWYPVEGEPGWWEAQVRNLDVVGTRVREGFSAAPDRAVAIGEAVLDAMDLPKSSPSVPDHELDQHVVEYVVDALDGEARNTALPPHGREPLYYKGNRLSLLDPDYLAPEDPMAEPPPEGVRLLKFLWIEAPQPGDLDASLDVVTLAADGKQLVREHVASLAGRRQFFGERILIRRGTVLRLRGLLALPGQPIFVRTVIAADISLADLRGRKDYFRVRRHAQETRQAERERDDLRRILAFRGIEWPCPHTASQSTDGSGNTICLACGEPVPAEILALQLAQERPDDES